jgi:tetratricopeptide (TPR) repeat protein
MAATLESVRKAVGKKAHSLAFAWLADLERQSGNLDGALLRINEGLAFFPDNLAGLIVQSAIYFDKQQWDEAAEICKNILRKDPFCLSALHRLGVINDKLGDVAERNYYYQRLHDLDPLNPFWSEQYSEVVVPPVPDTAVSQENSPSESVQEPVSSESVSPVPSSINEPVSLSSVFEKSSPASLPPDLSKSNDDDPFSSLSVLLPQENGDAAEVSFDNLENSLNDALSGFASEPTEKEFFPADDISGGDINSALSGIFGNAEVNADSEPVSPSFHIPMSLDEETPISEPVEEEAKEEVEKEEPKEEDEPKSLASAFDDIFGEDELPEEFVPLKPRSEEPSVIEESGPHDVSSAFEKTLGSEEIKSAPDLSLGEEPSAAKGSLFEKSFREEYESSILNLDESSDSLATVLAPVTTTPEVPAATNFTEDVSSSLNALFGDSDDLDLPVASPVAEAEPLPANSLEKEVQQAEDSLELPAASDAPRATLAAAVDSSFSALFGDEDELVLPPSANHREVDKSGMESAVSGAFDHLFNTTEETKDEKPLVPQGNNGVDFLMSGDSDDTVDSALVQDPQSSLDKKNVNLDERLNTKTLAEIYFGQGLYDEALTIYRDLVKKEPQNKEIAERLSIIEKKRAEKLGSV